MQYHISSLLVQYKNGIEFPVISSLISRLRKVGKNILKSSPNCKLVGGYNLVACRKTNEKVGIFLSPQVGDSFWLLDKA